MSLPPSSHDNLGRLVAQVARQWRRALDLRLRPFGLSEATWLPLLHLSRSGSAMRQKDIAAALSLDTSPIVRLLDALQSADFIERQDEMADRRVKTIHLTDKARSVIDQVEAASRTLRGELLDDIADTELETTFRVLKRIADRLADTGADTGD